MPLGLEDGVLLVHSDGEDLNCYDLLHYYNRPLLPALQRLATMHAAAESEPGDALHGDYGVRLLPLLGLLPVYGLRRHLQGHVYLHRAPLHRSSMHVLS